MSVRINPCFGCPLRNGCEQRIEFTRRVRGLGARSVIFNCDKLAAALTPGTRIEIATPVRDYRYHTSSGSEDIGFDYKITRFNVPATITTKHPTTFACTIDREPLKAAMEKCGDGETDVDRVRFRKTMRHSRIVRFLDEPKRTFCDFGNVRRPDGGCEARDGECGCRQFKLPAAAE